MIRNCCYTKKHIALASVEGHNTPSVDQGFSSHHTKQVLSIYASHQLSSL